MKKRILSIVTILCMMLALLPSMAFADGENENITWIELNQTSIDTYKNQEGVSYELSTGYYKLTSDIALDGDIVLNPDYDSGTITTVTLDLNGKTLSRNNEEQNTDPVIKLNISCNLTVTDSAGGGKIIGMEPIYLTRGNDYYNAETSFTLESGTIEATSGSAIRSRNSGTPTNVILNGGTVIGSISIAGSQNKGPDNLTISGSTVVYGDIYGYNIKLADGNAAVKVTFKQNDSTESDTDDKTYATDLVAKDSNAVKPTDPTSKGLEFTGWYKDAACTEPYNFSSAVSTATTVYAGWKTAESPKIEDGLTDGETYCGEATFTVTDNVGVASVGYYTTDSSSVTTLTAVNGKYTLKASEGAVGTVTVVATDTSGNKAIVTVTVNEGHTPEDDDGDCTTAVICEYCKETVTAAKQHDFTGGWECDETEHWHVCKNDGCTKTDTKVKHSGTDDGNCTTAVTCECGYVITQAETDHNFSDEWKPDKDGQHIRSCTVNGCSATDTANCTDTNPKDHNCDVCGGTLSSHTYEWQSDSENGQYWQKCSYCGDETEAQAIPDITINGADKVCRTDDYTFSITVPKELEVTLIETGYSCGKGGALDKFNTICAGETYTSVVSAELYDENESTLEAGAYITLADGFTLEITKTVEIYDEQIAPVATTDDQSSETGDSFNMGLLIALLIAACGTFTATLYRRRSTR